MKLNGDTIQFESRTEVTNIIDALEFFRSWRMDRPDKEYRESLELLQDAGDLIRMLDVMEMSW